MTHPVLAPGRVAVITGAASGIGLATCKRLASMGMRICMVDNDENELASAREAVAKLARGGPDHVLSVPTDVSDPDALSALRDTVYGRFGEVGLLMNNAAVFSGGGALTRRAQWERLMAVNLWGVIHGSQTFVPAMISQKTPALVVNTGSKQGITAPPGNTAYNVSKAGVKVYTEGLQHELRNTEGCQVTAHLLIPGWTTNGKNKPQPGAWMPDQVVDFLLAALDRGDFYILCPDGEVTREMDRRRILWAAGDLTENRPPLSRWHADFAGQFEKFSP